MAALLLLTLAGCADTVKGAPQAEAQVRDAAASASAAATSAAKSAPKTGAANAAPGQDSMAAAYTVMRKVDPCALHSLDAAAKVTGMQPDEIMPGISLGACDLDLVPSPRELPVWTLIARVGVTFDERRKKAAVEEQIGDIRFYKLAEPAGSGSSDRSCSYVMRLGEETGVELQVRRGAADPQPKTPCQVATEYLAEVGRYWKQPAIRADKVTSPTLRVADVDPCAGQDALAAVLGAPVHSLFTDPFTCTTVPSTGGKSNVSAMVSAEVAVETDPRGLLGGSMGTDYRAVTVNGKPGVAKEFVVNKKPTCSLTVIADEQVVLVADQAKPDAQKSFQVVKARAQTCDVATKAAEILLSAMR
ncbi:hypothetical protein [Alloactinosynnema sp. L-07]|uniref:DUF3558 domain-containing protein n=1 Tax=Alloactinosynnema sp. L-07 TaxID=1653480 RepID=UPI00065F0A2F|nr:DUF3558 domain-containing protein [Alloactinosynnema sp. L-07]CRK57006.1 hypothetical protein [Alloactinosynnema sp. L-07]